MNECRSRLTIVIIIDSTNVWINTDKNIYLAESHSGSLNLCVKVIHNMFFENSNWILFIISAVWSFDIIPTNSLWNRLHRLTYSSAYELSWTSLKRNSSSGYNLIVDWKSCCYAWNVRVYVGEISCQFFLCRSTRFSVWSLCQHRVRLCIHACASWMVYWKHSSFSVHTCTDTFL